MKSVPLLLSLSLLFLPCSTVQAEEPKPKLQTSYKAQFISDDGNTKKDITSYPDTTVSIVLPSEYTLKGWACYRRPFTKKDGNWFETGIQCKNSIVNSIVTIVMGCSMDEEDEDLSG